MEEKINEQTLTETQTAVAEDNKCGKKEEVS